MICKPKVRSYLGVCQSYATDCHNDHCVSQEHRAHLLSTSQAVKKPLASTQNSSQDAFLGASYSPDRLQLTSLPCKKKLSLVNATTSQPESVLLTKDISTSSVCTEGRHPEQPKANVSYRLSISEHRPAGNTQHSDLR